MGFEVTGQVGPQVISDGVRSNFRIGKAAEIIVQELHGRYYEQAVRGNIFSVANQVPVTTTVGLATTYTGLVLSNPVGSPANLVLLKASFMQSTAQTLNIEAFAIAFGFNGSTNLTHTTPVVPQSAKIGSGASANAKADSSAGLISAPVYGIFVGNTPSISTNANGGIIDFEGSTVLAPGAYAAWVTPAQASVAGMWFSFFWEEVLP